MIVFVQGRRIRHYGGRLSAWGSLLLTWARLYVTLFKRTPKRAAKWGK